MLTTHANQPVRRARKSTLPADVLCRHRDRLFRVLAREWAAPNEREELAVHFRGMPERYWACVDLDAGRWHLALFHAFYEQLSTEGAHALEPIVRWRHFTDRHLTEVAVCTWDRPGLLAHVAQAFAGAGISILHAQIFRRADNVMLALFQVADRQFDFVPRERLLEDTVKALRYLARAGPDPIPANPPSTAAPTAAGAVWVEYDTWSSSQYTVLMVETRDRPGLLYVIFREIHAAGLAVLQAAVITQGDVAGDVFFLTDELGRKATDSVRLDALRRRLGQVLAVPAA